MKMKLTKKGKTILLIILGIILLSSGSYLLWVVLQEKTIAPEESEAGGGAGSCCCADASKGCEGCKNSCKSEYECRQPTESRPFNLGTCALGGDGCGVCQTIHKGCYWSSEMGSTGDNYFYGCDGEYFKINPNSGLCYCSGTYNGTNCWKQSNQCKCANTCDSGPVRTCAQTKECEFPLNAYYDSDKGTCSCVRWDKQSHEYGLGTYCTTKPQQCSFSTTCLAEGMVRCGVSGDANDKTGCTVVDTCDSWCGGCGNLSVYKLYCKEEEVEENICEGSSWLEKPSGTFTSCSGITASVLASDPDGISKSSISVKVNGRSKTNYSTSAIASGTSITYEFLSSDCAEPGEYAISFTWKDSEGNSGDDCTLSASFTVIEEDEPYCGDGNLDEGEECDPGPADSEPVECIALNGEESTCSRTCTCPYCGDGRLSDDEQCELGNPTGYSCLWDDCDQSTCLCLEEDEPYCGDGNLDEGEQCEIGDPEGYLCTWDSCDEETCTCEEDELYCGDGILSDSEQCELGDPTGYTCLWDDCDQDLCICPGEQENPDWIIVKTAVKECVEGDEVYAKASYSIIIKNVGESEGSIDRVVDELDEKVSETYLNDISEEGEYASGLITWDLEGDDEVFSVDESVEFTYYIEVPAESFGIYENTVTAYPTEGDSFSADEDIDLECDILEEEEEIPQTGIFDSVLTRIALGIVMILIGMNWGNIIKLNYTLKEVISSQRIKKFERRVAKRK